MQRDLQALEISNSNNVLLIGLSFKDNPRVHIVLNSLDNITVTNITINSPEKSPNSDGIHVSGSTNVIIDDCHIATGTSFGYLQILLLLEITSSWFNLLCPENYGFLSNVGDDCISIVDGTAYICNNQQHCMWTGTWNKVTLWHLCFDFFPLFSINVTYKIDQENYLSWHECSIGSLGHNGANDKVEYIHVMDSVFIGATNGVRIKTWQVKLHLSFNHCSWTNCSLMRPWSMFLLLSTV